MAEISGPNLCVLSICGTTSLTFLIYHTYRFDGCRCLIPRRKDWFRGLLTWMLLLSNMCWVVWSGGWAYVKYDLGYVRVGTTGARSWPSALFPSEYVGYNPPLTVLLGICYSLIASLNAEEGLYWFHLMRSLRSPQTAVPFLSSRFFHAWIFISCLIAFVQLGVPWIGHDGNLARQLSKELLSGGILEFGVLIASTIVVLRFPKFLKDLELSGVGPDVRSRLYFFHEGNKVRCFFRFTFTLPLLVLGIDGLTSGMTINMNALGTDSLATITAGSFAAIMMLSIVLYLPRSSPSAKYNKVMIGNSPPQANHAASGFALMSLLKEGGQWEGVDEDQAGVDGSNRIQHESAVSSLPRTTSWGAGREEHWAERTQLPRLPRVLNNFTSPIGELVILIADVLAVEVDPVFDRPVEVHVHVEREVHKD